MKQTAVTNTKYTDGLDKNRGQPALGRRHCVDSDRNVMDLSLFFSHSLDMLCVAGLDGYFKHLNPAWTTQLGWSVEELLEKPFLEFVHSADRASTSARLARLAQGENTILFENRYLHRDGSFRWLQWNGHPEPATNLIYATARDITRQRELEQEILCVADREKEHLGRELHDGLSQTLAGIAAHSLTLSKSIYTQSELVSSNQAAEINKLLNNAVRDTRDLARGLTPVELNEDGLFNALDVMTINIQNLFRVSCEFTSSIPFTRFVPDVEKHLFRIAQEAVNNAITHGRADEIVLTIESVNGEGHLSVCDNGIGMSATAGNSNGLGLHTMAYRARLINGRLRLTERAPNGSIVSCCFPLKHYVSENQEINNVN